MNVQRFHLVLAGVCVNILLSVGIDGKPGCGSQIVLFVSWNICKCVLLIVNEYVCVLPLALMFWKNTPLFQSLCFSQIVDEHRGQIIHLCVCVCVFVRHGRCLYVWGGCQSKRHPSTHHTRPLANYVGMVSVSKATVPRVRVGWVQLVLLDSVRCVCVCVY